jgi:Ca2+-binding EF-hand superfamily protein
LFNQFEKIDTDNDGFLTHGEVEQAINKMVPDMTSADVKKLISEMDVDGDGKISFEGNKKTKQHLVHSSIVDFIFLF